MTRVSASDEDRRSSLPQLSLPVFLRSSVSGKEDLKRSPTPTGIRTMEKKEDDYKTGRGNSYLPDSCSDLKDQFLRLKEKFIKPELISQESTKEVRRLSLDNSVWIDPRELLDPNRNGEIGMKPVELMRELDKLNKSAKKLFVHDPWSNGAERWVLEDSCLRGYMTCWTIETGGELVVIIARTIKNLNANINPDISLQWIGRQLWGLTIQLPLPRSRELTMQHITVASSIDMALAKIVKIPQNESSILRTETKQPTCEPKKCDASEKPEGVGHTRSLSNDATSLMKASSHMRSLSSDATTSKHHRTLSGDFSAEVNNLSQMLAPISPYSSANSSTTKTWNALANPSISLTDEDPFQRCAPEKSGWLKKRSSGLNSWQLRWFELKGNRLYYFKHEKDGLPKGAIVLDKVYCIRGTGEQSFCLTISPSGTNSICMIKFNDRLAHHTFCRRSCTLRVAEDNEIELNTWIKAICRASFQCYLSINDPIYNNELSRYSSFQYLRETDPLLWEINPIDQTAIKKKAAQARTKADYTWIMSKYAHVLRDIILPRPRPISIEQTLRDIIPELFLINNILYGGETESIDDIFEVLEGYVKRFATSHDECVNIVSSVLQACARTIAGGDSFLVVRTLLGNTSGSTLIRPADCHGAPILIDISSATPSFFTITLQSVFVFHTLEDIENMMEDEQNEPLLRIQTLHVQEIDFATSKSTRHLKIRQLAKEEDDQVGESHSNRSFTYDYGALLDGLA